MNTATKPALDVQPLGNGEFGFVVRGTQDRFEAKRAVQRHLLEVEQYDPRDAVRVPPVARIGLFRWTPCSPRSCYDGGGHRVHLCYADQPGRGVWPGVHFLD